MKKKFFNWVAILAAAGLVAITHNGAQAQDIFTWNGSQSNTWTTAGNWSDATNFTFYPGQRNGNATPITNDTAVIDTTANTPIQLNSDLQIGALTIGANGIQINGTGSLNFGTLTVGANTGTAFGVAVGGSNLTMAVNAGNSVDFNGAINGSGQTFRADTGTINYNGAINLTSGTTTFRMNANNTAVQNFNGAMTGAGGVAYGGAGTFNHNVANSYTGNTTLGANSPNASGTHVINNDLAFSTGTVAFTGGGNPQTVQGDGSGPRTLANRIQVARDAVFGGTDQITLSGDVFQSNSRSITNNISGNNLVLSGRVFTANDGTSRVLTFSGSGTTQLNAAVYDRYDSSLGAPAASTAHVYGSLGYNGTGTLVLGSGFQANYTGFTEVRQGTLQVGTGGAAPALGGVAISGFSTMGTGSINFNHNDNVTLSTPLNYQLNVTNTGGGNLTLAGPSFGTGTITSSGGGTLFVNGSTYAGLSITDAQRPTVNALTVSSAQAANLLVGQSFTVSTVSGGNPASASLFVAGKSVNGDGSWTIDMSGNFASSSDTGLYTVVADAGTGTGARNVVANGGTVAGTGVIGGNLTVAPTMGSIAAPGASIGTLTVNGNGNILGTLEIEFNGSATQAIDLITFDGDLSLGAASTLDLKNVGGDLTAASYVFATYGGALTGTFANISGLQSGYSVNYAFNGNNIALVSAVPEPSSLMLLAPLAFAAARRRRRR